MGWLGRLFGGKRLTFQFSPRWKEMMIVTGPGGHFTLDFWMGIPTISLPPEERWRDVAPSWAAELWPELKAELEDWCRNNNTKLEIDEKAGVY
jgi:hypothetical protein